jgi:hypothetical protein
MFQRNLLTYLLIHGAEPFLSRRQLCSHSKISQHFMEPEGSIPCSQEPELYQSNPHYPILSLKIHFNIVHPSTSWSSQWSLSFWRSHQYSIWMNFSSPPFVQNPRPPHPSWFDHSNYTLRRVQVMKLVQRYMYEISADVTALLRLLFIAFLRNSRINTGQYLSLNSRLQVRTNFKFIYLGGLSTASFLIEWDVLFWITF